MIIGGSGLDWTDDFQNFRRSGLDRIQFHQIRTGFGLKNFSVRSSLMLGLVCKPKTLTIKQPKNKTLNQSRQHGIAFLGLAPSKKKAPANIN